MGAAEGDGVILGDGAAFNLDPQFVQNSASAEFAVWHAGHTRTRGLPHFLQNLAPLGLSVEQLGHFTWDISR